MSTAPEMFARRGGTPCSDPRPYRGCGLDNIFLCNGFSTEVVDGEEYVHVEDVEGLHCAIARHLVKERKVLAGKEIKFIRKVMDMTQSELARQIGATSQTIARWEKEQTEMPGHADLMLRLSFLVSLMTPEDFSELVKRLPEKLELMEEARDTPVQFRHSEKWAEAA